MLIQPNPEANEMARLAIAGWPAELNGVRPLSVKIVREAQSNRFVSATERSHYAGLGERVQQALEGIEPGTVLLIARPTHLLSLMDVQRTAQEWVRQLRIPPKGEVNHAIAFMVSDVAERDDMRLLWARAAARLHNHRLALILSSGGTPGHLSVDGPFRGRTVRWVQYLFELPIVSAEVLASMDSAGTPERNYRWSNRLAALRGSGLLIPLSAYEAETAEVRQAHADAMKRVRDRRPTRLYRSVLFDLNR